MFGTVASTRLLQGWGPPCCGCSLAGLVVRVAVAGGGCGCCWVSSPRSTRCSTTGDCSPRSAHSSTRVSARINNLDDVVGDNALRPFYRVPHNAQDARRHRAPSTAGYAAQRAALDGRSARDREQPPRPDSAIGAPPGQSARAQRSPPASRILADRCSRMPRGQRPNTSSLVRRASRQPAVSGAGRAGESAVVYGRDRDQRVNAGTRCRE